MKYRFNLGVFNLAYSIGYSHFTVPRFPEAQAIFRHRLIRRMAETLNLKGQIKANAGETRADRATVMHGTDCTMVSRDHIYTIVYFLCLDFGAFIAVY
ncbi:hypothetical protein K1719_023712 [Acacia pycnantha]|nr:hypothetical protein K1719_023712 [Acacia pycnantha]